MIGKTKPLTTAQVEAEFKAIVDVLGGNAFSAGGAYSASGALGAAHMARIRLPNAYKNEPYSLCAVQFRVPSVVRDTAPLGPLYVRSLVLGDLIAASGPVVVVSANVVYTSLSAGTAATMTFTLTVSDAITLVNSSVSGLAPATYANVTMAATPTLAAADFLTLGIDVTGITGGGATDTVNDIVFTLVCKALHVA